MPKPVIHAFFDEPTNTVSYLVADPETKAGRRGRSRARLRPQVRQGQCDLRRRHSRQGAREEGFTIGLVLETHVHADHLSGAPYIKLKTGAKVAIGERIKEVQKIFRPVFNAMDVSGEGSEFDMLFKDGDTFKIGNLKGEVIATPGHTPACVSYRIGDAVFVGDTMFMPDYGTARADFPGGDARTLYRSIRRLMALPRETRLFMCHDYLPKEGRRHFAWETTVGEERARNVHVHEGVTEDEFVKMRTDARCDAVRARPADAVDPGQHAGRQAAAGGCQWRSLSPRADHPCVLSRA